MRRLLIAAATSLAMATALSACNGENASVRPMPVTMTEEAVGHFCQMYVLDHAGPKAQIHLAGFDEPLFFSQVTDGVAYLQGIERDGEITAIYVSDMDKAPSWSTPGADNWIDAESAIFVINSEQLGGMGLPEAIPFGSQEKAEAFIRDKGGIAVRLDAIPQAYVRPPLDLTASVDGDHPATGH
ncbi:MAG: copper resistance protein CopZ [Phyllobacteriaceae bacterium]|nr:copper resistance protein CopZ [Phyllobacteriaceae bacterium]MBA91667.1 copper resistance protein CopZ [Phyllobacteriaceae bacterium]